MRTTRSKVQDRQEVESNAGPIGPLDLLIVARLAAMYFYISLLPQVGVA
jgi:hypothetical protein